ncbi:MAG: hypothetical protein HND48_08700 [Chloroflexi bacterium]|nr:hypothetical protein [Chloroflexota bacterium]
MFKAISVGAGLSSSAALEMAAGAAFCALADRSWHPSKWRGVDKPSRTNGSACKPGIMDRTISAAGQAGERAADRLPVDGGQSAPLPPGSLVVILDTSTRRGLVHSAYNERRQQCESGGQALRRCGAA